MISDDVRSQTVWLLIALRAEYLAAGANPLKHWDQLQSRLRSAARTTTSVGEWVTTMSRSLGLGAPTRTRAGLTEALAMVVGEQADEWLNMLESEHGYLLALARLEAERRKKEDLDKILEEATLRGTA